MPDVHAVLPQSVLSVPSPSQESSDGSTDSVVRPPQPIRKDRLRHLALLHHFFFLGLGEFQCDLANELEELSVLLAEFGDLEDRGTTLDLLP